MRTVERFRALGYRVTQHGVRLFGPVPHVAPQAWFHAIPPGLTDQEIKDLSLSVEKVFPREYMEFLRLMNGVKLFAGTFSLYGMRPAMAGRGVDSAFLPFDLVDPNGIERPHGFRRELLIIGGYKRDGSHLAVDISTGQVERLARDSGVRLNVWPSLHDFIGEEVRRLDGLYDDNGRLMVDRDMLLPRELS